MANDIQASISGNLVKNGSAIVGCFRTGPSAQMTNNLYVQNYPTIAELDDKYDDRFYNGIFVELIGGGTIVGG